MPVRGWQADHWPGNDTLPVGFGYPRPGQDSRGDAGGGHQGAHMHVHDIKPAGKYSNSRSPYADVVVWFWLVGSLLLCLKFSARLITRPGIIGWDGDHTCSYRIELDIPETGQQIAF